MKARIITVTGPVAAGKTTFSTYLSEILGASIIDLDDLAKEVYRESDAKRFIRREIEPHAFSIDGNLIKSALFRTIFSDPLKRERLEKYIYPVLKEKVSEIAGSANERARIFIIEGVKLKEASIYELADLKVAVLASRESQWQRLRGKGLPTYKIQYLLNAQKRRFDYLSEADLVIHNDSDLNELKEAAFKVSELI